MEQDETIIRKWIAEIGEGDLASFTALYDNYSKQLYSLALQLVENSEVAQEVIQDTFLAIWKDASKYEASRSKVFSWMVMILRRRAIDRIRLESRRIPGPVEAGPEMISNQTASSEAEINDESTVMRGILQQLPEEQRRALELAFFDGMTHQEIATSLQQPVGTVKSRIRMGLKKLRGKVERSNG